MLGPSYFRRLCNFLPALVLFLAALPAYPQLFSFGVKAGVPFVSPYSATTQISGFPTTGAFQDHFIVGPTAEVHLPFHLSLEVDALYRRNGFSELGGITNLSIKTTPNDWQVPLLVKYEIGSAPIRPFLNAGVVYRHAAGISGVPTAIIIVGTGTTLCPVTGCPYVATTANPNTVGYAAGAGLTFKLLHIRIAPEVRFTQWDKSPLTATYINTDKKQLDLLVGITF